MADRRYRAFISYRHADNTQEGRRWAEWLHRALERYVVPPDLVGTPNLRGEAIPASLYPIFRDEDELPASADLAAGIRRALEVSDHLIVLCSPRSAASKWVRKEVRGFKELGRSDRILAVMIDGEPNADDPAKARDGLMPEHECLCEELRFGVPNAAGAVDWTVRTEPLAADLRPEGMCGEGFVSADAYREHLERTASLAAEKISALADAYRARLELGLLKVTAGLLAVPVGQLTARDAAYRAVLAEKEAQRQREIAERERFLAEQARQAAQEAEAANTRAQTLLVEAARSDRFVAEEKFRAGDGSAALAHLARAIHYDPRSTLAAEKAAPALETWRHPPPLSFLIGHTSRVFGLDFSPDGARVVTASADGTARVWDAATGELVATFSDHLRDFLKVEFAREGVGDDGYVFNARFSPDGARVVTASGDKTARVWEASNGQLVAVLSPYGDEAKESPNIRRAMLHDAQFSPDGTRVVTVSADGTARIWLLAGNETPMSVVGITRAVFGRPALPARCVAILSDPMELVETAQFSPDGTRIVTGFRSGTVRLWKASSGKLMATLPGHEKSALSAQFSPDGARIVTASQDKTARIWDASSGKLVATLSGHEDEVRTAEFSHDGAHIVTASKDKTARVWEASTGKLVATLSGHESEMHTAQFSPDGRKIVTASGDRTPRVWEASTGQLVAILSGHKSAIRRARFSPDGAHIITVSEDTIIRVWETPFMARQVILSGHENSVTKAQFSAHGAHIVTASKDNTARVWESFTGQLVTTLSGHERRIDSAQFSPDGTRIVTASEDKTARVWEASTGHLLAVLSDGKEPLVRAAFSPDGARIIVFSKYHRAHVWEASTGRLVATLSGCSDPTNAPFSPDGARIVTPSSENTARVWEASSGQPMVTLSGHGGPVTCAQFSPDGSRIVTGSWDKTARIWDASTGRLVTTLSGHEGWVESAQFSPDGMHIVTASSDDTARVWQAFTGELVASLSTNEVPLQNPQFSPDGARIVTTSWKRLAQVWEASTGQLVTTLSDPKGWVETAQFRPEGARLITAYGDNTARVWTIFRPIADPPPSWFRDFLAYLGQSQLNADGKLETIPIDDWLALRVKLREVLRAEAGKSTPYLDILRRFVRE